MTLKSLRPLAWLSVLGLAACTFRPVDPPANAAPETMLGQCCETLEVFPAGLIALVDPKADHKAALGTSHRFRPPHLERFDTFTGHIRGHLRPLDILTTADKGLLSGRLIPGYFSHSLVYLGTPEQLKSEGLWSHPALRSHWDRLRAGEVFYESIPDQVGFATEAEIFNVDAVGVFRPRISRRQKQVALDRLISRLGTPFDRRMDSSTEDCLYCAELLDYGFPWLVFPEVMAYGRPVLPPDRIARHALETDFLDFVGFFYGDGNKAMSAGAATLAATLRAYAPGR